jgi:ribosomal protein S18 acetylase RimI-like enzyme
MSGPRIATDADAVTVGQVLAAGFEDDPVMTWVFPVPETRRKLDVMFGFIARELFVPFGSAWICDGAAAAWTPPNPKPWASDRAERFFAELSEVCSDDDFERLGAMEAAMEAAHPKETHWYLSAVAAMPERRGGGLGTTLLAASLEVVDRDGLPAYLESSNPRNITLYERHGFEVTGRIEIPGGPPMIPMWRPAAR